MNINNLANLNQTAQLTILRKTLDMVSAQAENIISQADCVSSTENTENKVDFTV